MLFVPLVQNCSDVLWITLSLLEYFGLSQRRLTVLGFQLFGNICIHRWLITTGIHVTVVTDIAVAGVVVGDRGVCVVYGMDD